MMMDGNSKIVAIAVNPCQSTCTKPMNSEMTTGKVLDEALVKTKANRNSFHDQIKDRIAVAANPGATLGNIIQLKSRK